MIANPEERYWAVGFPAAWALIAVAYTYVETYGSATFGKRILRLRLVDVGGPPPGERSRFLLRWALARAPLVAVAVVYGGLAAGPSTVEWSDFEGEVLHLQVGLLGAYAFHWLVGVTCVPAPGRITLWEWISGVELRHALPLTYQSRKRGFEVVPAGTAPLPLSGREPEGEKCCGQSCGGTGDS